MLDEGMCVAVGRSRVPVQIVNTVGEGQISENNKPAAIDKQTARL